MLHLLASLPLKNFLSSVIVRLDRTIQKTFPPEVGIHRKLLDVLLRENNSDREQNHVDVSFGYTVNDLS
jgi:hypothetical protein